MSMKKNNKNKISFEQLGVGKNHFENGNTLEEEAVSSKRKFKRPKRVLKPLFEFFDTEEEKEEYLENAVPEKTKQEKPCEQEEERNPEKRVGSVNTMLQTLVLASVEAAYRETIRDVSNRSMKVSRLTVTQQKLLQERTLAFALDSMKVLGHVDYVFAELVEHRGAPNDKAEWTPFDVPKFQFNVLAQENRHEHVADAIRNADFSQLHMLPLGQDGRMRRLSMYKKVLYPFEAKEGEGDCNESKRENANRKRDKGRRGTEMKNSKAVIEVVEQKRKSAERGIQAAEKRIALAEKKLQVAEKREKKAKAATLVRKQREKKAKKENAKNAKKRKQMSVKRNVEKTQGALIVDLLTQPAPNEEEEEIEDDGPRKKRIKAETKMEPLLVHEGNIDLLLRSHKFALGREADKLSIGDDVEDSIPALPKEKDAKNLVVTAQKVLDTMLGCIDTGMDLVGEFRVKLRGQERKIMANRLLLCYYVGRLRSDFGMKPKLIRQYLGLSKGVMQFMSSFGQVLAAKGKRGYCPRLVVAMVGSPDVLATPLWRQVRGPVRLSNLTSDVLKRLNTRWDEMGVQKWDEKNYDLEKFLKCILENMKD